MTKRFKLWEISLLVAAAVILVGSAVIYFSGFPIGSYVFGTDDAAGGEAIGQVGKQEGTLKRERVGGSEFVSVNQGSPLYAKDVLVTASDAHATVTLDDGSAIEMAPSTMIRLELEKRLDVSGIFRVNRVQVLSGEVKGTAAPKGKASKLVIRSEEQEVEIDDKVPEIAKTVKAKPKAKAPVIPPPTPAPSPKTSPTREALPSPSPSPALEALLEPSQSPSPEPTLSAEPSFVIVSPKKDAVLSISKDQARALAGQEPSLAVTITIKLSKYGSQFVFAQSKSAVAIVRVFQEQSGNGADPVLVAQQAAPFKSDFPASMIFTARQPGRYRIEVRKNDLGQNSPENPMTSSSFQVSPDFEGITLHKPTFKSEKTSEDEPRRSSAFLSWDAYAGVKTYRLQLSRADKAHEDLQLPSNNFVVVRESISDTDRKYVVSANLPTGWLVKSREDEFVFDFTPPSPVTPANQAVLNQNSNLWDGKGILLTWQKTGVSEGYVLELSEDPSFAKLIVNRRQTDNFLVFKPSSRDVTYYWRVRATAQKNVSQPSEVFSFSVEHQVPAATQ